MSAKSLIKQAYRVSRESGLTITRSLVMSTANEMQADLNSLAALSNELIGKDTPEMEVDRHRNNDGHLNYLENDTSTYGRSLRQTRQKYAGDVHDYKPQLGLTDCNPELSEVEKVVVSSVAKIVEQN